MSDSVNPRPVPMLDVAAQNGPLREALREAFERVMDHGRFILGPEVRELEERLEAALPVPHAVGVSSGTDALLLALMALGVGPGDEVITTPMSFFATAGSVHRVGARPVFVDIDPGSLNLDPTRIEQAITPRTRAILPVHLFGRPAEMGKLREVARVHGLALIEDAAQALSAHTAEGPVGSLGDLACFSFFPSKNLGGFGDGGLVTCADPELAERLRLLRAHGARARYYHASVGGNFRLDTLQAAMLLVKWPKLASWTAARREHAVHYEQVFRAAGLPLERLRLPELVPGHVINQYVIRSDRRDAMRAALEEARIATAIYYPLPLHRQECFAALGYGPGAFPEAERACDEVLALPLFPELTPEQVARVAHVAIEALR